MKKFAAIAMLALLAISSVFATVYVGTDIYPFSFSSSTTKSNSDSSYRTTTNSISTAMTLNANVGYLYDISKEHSIGAEFDIAYLLSSTKTTIKTDNATIEGNSVTTNSFLYSIDFVYSYHMSDEFSVLAKAGYHSEVYTQKNYKMSIYGMNFDAGFMQSVTKNLAFVYGVDMNAIFGGKEKSTVSSTTTTTDIKLTQVTIAPYISIACVF